MAPDPRSGRITNASEHAATGQSPYFLNYGRTPRFPGEGERTTQGCDGAERLHEVIFEAQVAARETLHKYWARMKSKYDQSRRDTLLEPGTRVLVRLSDYERNQFPCRSWRLGGPVRH